MGHIEFNTSDIKLCLGAAEVSAAYLGDKQVYPVETTLPNYLSFTNRGTEEVVIMFDSYNRENMLDRDFEYSFDGITWTDWESEYFNSSLCPHVQPNETLYLRGDNTRINFDTSTFMTLVCGISTDDLHPAVEVHGNIMSLLSKTGFEQLTSVPQYCFYSFFLDNTVITTAPELPATIVGQYAYYDMFNGCTSLTTAPVLPATTLNTYCYANMFTSCTSLTTTPALPATTLAENCYRGMFYGCTGLITAGTISATTLATRCCYYMFYKCTSLTTTPALPATALATECYYNMFAGCTSLTTANILPATALASYCYCGMFNGCTALTVAPTLPATSLQAHCYEDMFVGCIALTTAPDLPATILKMYCYKNMFTGCTSLNYIKALFTTTPSTSYTAAWVENVAATGTFVKNSRAGWNVTGTNGIPTGWTVTTASA